MRLFASGGRRSRGTDRGAAEDRRDPDPAEDADAGAGHDARRGTYRPDHGAGCPCARCAGARGLNLEVYDERVPILATRVARIRARGRRKPFGPLTQLDWFGVTARARCFAGGREMNRIRGRHDRVVPDPTCTCGFYSVTADRHYELTGQPELVRLDVMLAGRVIICRTGYRAGWQQVLGIRVPACACGGVRDEIWHPLELSLAGRGQQSLRWGHAGCRHNPRTYEPDVLVSREAVEKRMPVPIVFEGES